MDTIRLKLGSREARHQERVVGSGLHDVRELLQNLWETLTEPDGSQAIHWRADEEQDVGTQGGELGQLLEDLQQGGLDTMGGSVGTRRGRQEIGDAGDQADGGLGTDGAERGRQHPDVATLDNLGAGH